MLAHKSIHHKPKSNITNQWNPNITYQSKPTHHKLIKVHKSPTNQCQHITNQSKSSNHQPINVQISQTNQSPHITHQSIPHITNQSKSTHHKLIKVHTSPTNIGHKQIKASKQNRTSLTNQTPQLTNLSKTMDLKPAYHKFSKHNHQYNAHKFYTPL